MERSNPVEPGFRYARYSTAVRRAEQTRKLDCCGIDPALYGAYADVTALASEAILAARRSGLDINGNVHVSQTFEMTAPVMLDEELRVEGEVTAVEADRRGDMMHSRFVFRRLDGSVPLVTTKSSLRLDPAAARAVRPAAAAAASRGGPPASMRYLWERPLSPERVAAYSREGENLIHSDPEVARRFGFRAPIAGGLMAVRYMMEALYGAGPVAALDMHVRFRRPMFWDERLQLWGCRNGQGSYDELAVLKQDDRAAVTAQIRAVAPAR